MGVYVALLRAVNVGGTGRLSMTTLTGLCEAAGFTAVRTYIASGNVVFGSEGAEDAVRSALEDRLRAAAGTKIGVVVRTAAEVVATLASNPFPDWPRDRVSALFVDGRLPTDPYEGVRGLRHERISLGPRGMYILYPDGIGSTRLRMPAERQGTARNMNTVAKLATMAGA